MMHAQRFSLRWFYQLILSTLLYSLCISVRLPSGSLCPLLWPLCLFCTQASLCIITYNAAAQTQSFFDLIPHMIWSPLYVKQYQLKISWTKRGRLCPSSLLWRVCVVSRCDEQPCVFGPMLGGWACERCFIAVGLCICVEYSEWQKCVCVFSNTVLCDRQMMEQIITTGS